jgi:hypothetical protein
MASFCSTSAACGPCHKHTSLRNVAVHATPAPQGSRAVDPTDQSRSRRALLSLIPLTLAAPAALASPLPFLKSTGASGFLADEEEFLLNLRKDAESKARAELDAERKQLTSDFEKDQGLYGPASLSSSLALCVCSGVLVWIACNVQHLCLDYRRTRSWRVCIT